MSTSQEAGQSGTAGDLLQKGSPYKPIKRSDAMKIKAFGQTIVGRRQENQDAFYQKVFETPKGCINALAAVCDGMGGQQGGQEASRIAVEVLGKHIQHPPHADDSIRNWITDLVDSIQGTLVEESRKQPDLEGMGTTLVMAIITDTSVWVANVGDSRGYKINTETAEQLTTDHTAVQDAVDRGLYTLEDVKSTPSLQKLNSALIRNLGDGSDARADIHRYEIGRGDIFLLCSDGFSGGLADTIVSESVIHSQLIKTKDLKTAVNNLISIAFQNKSTDNITIVLLELGELDRSKEPVKDEPLIETLIQNELKQGQKFRKPNKQEKLYQYLIPVLIILIVALCISIARILWWQQQSPPPSVLAPEPVLLEQPVIPEELKGPVETKTSPPEPLSVAWSNYDADDTAKYRKEGKLTFKLRHAIPGKIIVSLHISDDPAMGDVKIENLSNLVKSSTVSVPLMNLGLTNKKWYLQLVAENDDIKTLSKIMAIKIVGE